MLVFMAGLCVQNDGFVSLFTLLGGSMATPTKAKNRGLEEAHKCVIHQQAFFDTPSLLLLHFHNVYSLTTLLKGNPDHNPNPNPNPLTTLLKG
jgi:hypothetical protein